jgi:hypothetical protein
MKLFLFDVRELMSGSQYILQPGDAGIGIHLKEDNQTISTEPGIPEHHIISSKNIVTFGIPRLLKQDQRNSMMSVASQVYNFIVQNPDWYPNYVYRPVFDVSIDDAIALALMNKQHRQKLLLSGTKLMALLSELNEWVANKYNFVKIPIPRLLNYLLKIQQYPFYDYPGKSRIELCEMSLLDLTEAIMKDFDNIEPVIREYPEDLKFDILHENEKSLLVKIKSERYGADELIAQNLFEYRPGVVRVIAARKVKGTTKHHITIYNSRIYTPDLSVFNYANTKELNIEEKKAGGDPEWKNLKVTALGPRKGTSLALEIVWKHTCITS